AAEPGHLEVARPTVVADRLHRRLAPLRFVVRPVAEAARDHVVPVAEGVALDRDQVADDALDREAAAVDDRHDPLDRDARAAPRRRLRQRRPGYGVRGRRLGPLCLPERLSYQRPTAEELGGE